MCAFCFNEHILCTYYLTNTKYILRIEKTDEDTGKVVVSIIEAQTEVENGGRLGNTLANTMKKSQFEGRNAVSWTEQTTNDDDTAMKSYNIEGSLQLTLTIDLPGYLPIPVSKYNA